MTADKPQFGELAETPKIPALSEGQVSREYLELDKTSRAASENRKQMFAVLGLFTWLAIATPLAIAAWKIALSL